MILPLLDKHADRIEYFPIQDLRKVKSGTFLREI